MSKFRAVVAVGVVVFCTVFIAGCSGKGAITVTLSPSSTATIDQDKTQNITATVANDTSNQGVTWSLGTSVGSLTNQTKTSVTYVAPAVVSTTTSATVTATSVANTAATASVTITINPVLAIATTSLPVGTQNSPYFGVISATGATGTFTWTLTSGVLPAGLTLSSSTTSSITISGTPTATGTSKFTMQVTAGSSTVSQSLSITINPPPPLSVGTRSLPNGFVGTAYSSALSATSGTPPYTWSVVGSLPSGLSWLNLNPDGTITGTPTQQGSFTFTVQVVDSSSPAQTATGAIGITIQPANAFNSQLKGTYAFLVSGFGAGGQYAIAGSLVADGGGNITSGVIDDPINALLGSALPGAGTYQINSNGLGTISITPSAGGTRVFQLALMPTGAGGVSTGGKLLECDNGTCGTSGSGVLLQQDTSAFSASVILGNYAFGFLGADGAGGRYALGGSFSADGQGNVSNGLLDSDDAGVLLPGGPATPTAFSASAFGSIGASTGRTTLTLTPSGQANINLAVYVVSATQLLAIETDKATLATNPLVSGTILQQSASTLSFTGVFETTALNSGTPVSQVGLLTPSSGSMSTSFDVATGGTITTGSPGSGTYSIGSGGRVTLSGSALASSDPVLYLLSDSAGFLVGTDPAVTFGVMEFQSGTGSFGNSSLSGTYAGGSVAPVAPTATNQVDIAIQNGGLTFTSESASVNGGLIQSQTSPVYSIDSTGRGTTTGPETVFYMVSGSEFWLLNPNGTVEKFQQ